MEKQELPEIRFRKKDVRRIIFAALAIFLGKHPLWLQPAIVSAGLSWLGWLSIIVIVAGVYCDIRNEAEAWKALREKEEKKGAQEAEVK